MIPKFAQKYCTFGTSIEIVPTLEDLMELYYRLATEVQIPRQKKS